MQPINRHSPTPPGAPTKPQEKREEARLDRLFDTSLDLSNRMATLFQTAAANINAAKVGPTFRK